MPAMQTQHVPLPDAAILAANFTQAQERSANTFARAYDAFAKTAQAILEKEPELFKLETDQMMSTLMAPPATGGHPAAMLREQCERMRNNADQIVASMRHINDLTWDCGWRIAAIYAEGIQDTWQQMQTMADMPPARKTEGKKSS